MRVDGVWIPLVTPFSNDAVDFDSFKELIDHYTSKTISGLIPAGTTGESPTISDDEFEAIIDKTMEFTEGRVPVYIGIGGNHTAKVVKQVKIAEKYRVQGILSVSPYYNRPEQKGIIEHFKKISESTDLNIIMYNIPYRTGRNMENTTIHRLAECRNIIGIKDCSGSIDQSMQLLLNRPHDGFSILTGEDILFYTTLLLGGDGGILASANCHTEHFIDVYRSIRKNDHQSALAKWKKLAGFISLLFEEPNPSPLKYCLFRAGLIRSPETRLPLTGISLLLQEKLDAFLDAGVFADVFAGGDEVKAFTPLLH
jgi:4-hydroxy-tetrahydrodipicolinate synthase